MKRLILSRVVRVSLIVLTFALALASAARAQLPVDPPAPAASAPATAPAMDPKADELLRKVTDFYKSLKTATFTVRTTMNVEGPGRKQKSDTTAEIAVERPNKLAVIQKGHGMGAGQLLSDGKHLWTYIPVMRRYAEETAPATLDQLLESPAAAVAQYANIALVLFGDKPHEKLTADAAGSKFLGEQEIDGKKYIGLRLMQDRIDFDIWVAQGDQPLVRRIVPDMSRQLAQMIQQMPQMKDMKFEAAVNLTDWTVNQPIPAERFTFVPAAGVDKVASVQAIFAERADGMHPLVGQSAPDFTMDLVGGGQAKLADHKDKNAVVLAFWTIQHPSAVPAMPVINEVAKDAAGKGVAFYSVNLQDDAEVIAPFLKQHNLDLKVALDPNGDAGGDYAVVGLPQLVLIGKDGIVKAVDIGVTPDQKAFLIEQIDAVIAGKTPATQPAPSAHAPAPDASPAGPAAPPAPAAEPAPAAAVPAGPAAPATAEPAPAPQPAPAAK